MKKENVNQNEHWTALIADTESRLAADGQLLRQLIYHRELAEMGIDPEQVKGILPDKTGMFKGVKLLNGRIELFPQPIESPNKAGLPLSVRDRIWKLLGGRQAEDCKCGNCQAWRELRELLQ